MAPKRCGRSRNGRPMILDPLDVMGVERFIDTAWVLRVRLKTQPSSRWAVARELNRRVKERFDALAIESPLTALPRPEHHPAAARPGAGPTTGARGMMDIGQGPPPPGSATPPAPGSAPGLVHGQDHGRDGEPDRGQDRGQDREQDREQDGGLSGLAAALRATGFAFVHGPDMRRRCLHAAGLAGLGRLRTHLGRPGAGHLHGRRRTLPEAAPCRLRGVVQPGIQRKPAQPHYQSRDYNALNGGIARWFDPGDGGRCRTAPTFQAILRTCHALFDGLTPAPALARGGAPVPDRGPPGPGRASPRRRGCTRTGWTGCWC